MYNIDISTGKMQYTNQYIFVKTSRETKTPRKSPKEAFHYFLRNSNIQLLCDSSVYGMLFKCVFRKKENKSPYFYIDYAGVFANVTEIVIKIMILADSRPTSTTPDISLLWKYGSTQNTSVVKECNNSPNFIKETQAMLDIAERGIQKLHRNSPVLLFSDIYELDTWSYRIIRQQLIRNSAYNSGGAAMKQIMQLFDSLSKTMTQYDVSLGIIAMEFVVPDYRVYCDIIKPIINDEIKVIPGNEDIHKYDSKSLSRHSTRLRWLYNITRYDILLMAVDTGYTQGDYHTENLLVNEARRFTMIVDLGKAVAIPKHEVCKTYWLELIKHNFIDEVENLDKIQSILTIIYDTTFVDEKENSAEYKWLKTVDAEDIRIIIAIHKSRKWKTSETVFDHYFHHRNEYIFSPNPTSTENDTLPTLYTQAAYYLRCLG